MSTPNASETHIDIPASSATVSVSAIDSARLLDLPWNLFIGPPLEGVKGWNCSGYAFLVTHTDRSGSQRRVLFDLAPAVDWKHTLPPPQVPMVQEWENNGARIIVEDQMHNILAKEGIELGSGDTLLWSHTHWDHIGKPSLFPKEVPLLVGPGVLEAFGPGYPENQEASWYTKDLAGRTMTEVTFENSPITIGGMRAIDFFNDGSFYLLDAPGHHVGHMNGLARVSSDSFVYLGADSYHHPSQIRPNQGNPLPDSIDIPNLPALLPCPCPGHTMKPLYDNIAKHAEDKHYRDFAAHTTPNHTPMLTIGWLENDVCISVDPDEFVHTVEKIQSFDADSRIFCISSHDIALAGVLDFFPKTIDHWKEEGWKEKGKWRHLADFGKVLETVRERRDG